MSDCLLTTPRAQQWLAESRAARILHLFDEVCNVVNEQGEVLSLVSQQVGAGPFAMVLAERPAWPADRHSRVHIDRRRKRLVAGPLTVDYGDAPCWQPKVAWRRLRDGPALQGMARPAVALSPDVGRLLEELLDGICGDRRAVVRYASTRLAGRGTGLTPSGDDLLVGVLYALWTWQPEGGWPSLIADAAAPRTATLSAAFLRAAAAGEATAPWHRLAAGEEEAVAEIVATGHRSGAETWTGFVTAGARLGGEWG